MLAGMVALLGLAGCQHPTHDASAKPSATATPKAADPADPNYVPPVKPSNPEITTPGKKQ
jgi:hypothetical protein